MSSTRDGSRKLEAGSGRLDKAIDRAVREMLDVEPPSGLRGRVLDRIGRPTDSFVPSAFRRKAVWLAAPLAAAAILVLAVLMPSESGRPVEAPPQKAAGDVHLPSVAVVRPAPQSRPQAVVAKAGRRAPRAQQIVEGAMVPDAPLVETAVEPLPGPAPLGVARLTGPPAPAVTDVGVAPIQVRALEVNALTETPRERREE